MVAFECTETVSILHALIFGADGACISVSIWSVLWLVIPTVGLIALVSGLGGRYAKQMLGIGKPIYKPEPKGPHPVTDLSPLPDNGPFETRKGWFS